MSEVGVLVPLYRFYPSIDSFLDTAVKRTIDQAKDNASLKPFDIEVLRVLFLIRYVDEIEGNIDNLVTLCIDQIDADRLALKKQIEESLLRLEKETLINRSGDNFFFLTNEERDINREIKSLDLSSSEEAKLLGEIIFDDVLKGTSEASLPSEQDGLLVQPRLRRLPLWQPGGQRPDGPGLHAAGRVRSRTVGERPLPAGKRAGRRAGRHQARRRPQPRTGTAAVPPNREVPPRQVRRHPARNDQTHSPCNGRGQPGAAGTAEECARQSGDRCDLLCRRQRVEIKSSAPQSALDEALEYLIDNTFPKMAHITKFSDEPKRELQAILRANDIQKAAMAGVNDRAMEEVRDFISLSDRANHPVVLFEMIEKFGKRPYGWSDDEVLILVARLLVLGEIHLVTSGAPIAIDRVFENITAPRKQRSITVVRRKMTDPKVLQQCRNLGKDVFSEMGPDSEDGLFEFLKAKCQGVAILPVQLQGPGRHRQLPRPRRDHRWAEPHQGAPGSRRTGQVHRAIPGKQGGIARPVERVPRHRQLLPAPEADMGEAPQGFTTASG